MKRSIGKKYLALLAVGALLMTACATAPEGEAVAASAASLSVEGAPSAVQWDQDPWLPAEGDAAQRLTIPSLTQPFYNTVVDVHATTSAADFELIFSTAGNYHSALRRILHEEYFPSHPSVLTSNLLTTSPPISLPQMQTGLVKVGNILFTDAQPHLVGGPGGYLNNVAAAGYLSGPRIPITRSYGNVILKRRGDPLIRSFWDLRHVPAGEFASSHPSEGGSFNNYRTSVYEIARNSPRHGGMSPERVEAEAAELRDRLFNDEGVISIGAPMHRSVPHLIASGEARAGLLFLHLAVTAMRENPGVFTAVYLSPEGGETDDPDVLAQGQTPLTGNRVAVMNIQRTTTPVNAAQSAAREDFISALLSPEFTAILADTGLRRP